MPPTALHRIHSILKHAVAMRDTDIDLVCSQAEAILADETFSQSPQLTACVGSDGWLPIASLLNYSALGQTVWPFGGVGVVADCLNARGSQVIELSGDSSCVRRMPLRVQLRSAVEYIFSDHNYHKDVHLQLLQESDGFVPFHKIATSYQSVQSLIPMHTPMETVRGALMAAHCRLLPPARWPPPPPTADCRPSTARLRSLPAPPPSPTQLLVLLL